MSLAKKTQAFVVAVVVVGAGSVAYARMLIGEERSIPYQGVLEQNGVASDGTLAMRFTLFPALATGAEVWSEEQDVTVDNGRFAVVLGDGNDVGDDVLSDAVLATPTLFLEIAVDDGAGNFTTLSPRQEIVPVPLAARAATVVDKSITGPKLGDGTRFGLAASFVNGQYRVDRQVPLGWTAVIAGSNGNISLFTTGSFVGLNYVCTTSSHDVNVVVMMAGLSSPGIVPIALRTTAGNPIDAGFDIVCVAQ